MNNGFNRYHLQRHLANLQKQRNSFARFNTPTARKKVAETDVEIAQVEALLQPAPAVKPASTERVFIHPRTGTTYNGL